MIKPKKIVFISSFHVVVLFYLNKECGLAVLQNVKTHPKVRF